jgi:hypothetical protein
MVRTVRPIWFVSSLLGLAAVLALSVISVVPAQAATNATLGDLNAATPSANKYAGCVASVLTGGGVTFGSAASLGSTLAALWPTLPSGVADACKQAVDGHQPQVCVSPANPATCPAIGAATAAAAADAAAGFSGNWKIVTDGVGTGGYAQTPLATSGASAPMAVASGTFTTPTSVCTTKDCTVPPAPGLWTDCGPVTCGPVTALTVSAIGRTPNGENSVRGHLQVVDGFGNSSVIWGIFGGSSYWGYGCSTAECPFTARLTVACKDVLGASANCGGQTLTVTFTFDSGAGGDCGCAGAAPAIGQLVELQLAASNLNASENPTVCLGILDCMRYDDSRLGYLDGNAKPTAVLNAVAAPSAVNDLAASSLGCLVGVDLRKSSAVSCLDVTGAFAPLVQTAHAPVAPPPPPTIAAVASPSGATSGWEHSSVAVTLTASDGTGPGIAAITYSATGAQPIPVTAITASSAQVTVTVDGTTTIDSWATDTYGTPSTTTSLTVKVDHTAPAVSCATPPSGWSASDVTIACSASDAMSGLANPSQAQFSLTTAVPAGTESNSATTNSVSVCDAAGNCATAGPITGIKVDRKAPAISCAAAPAAWSSADVTLACTATDGVSGLADPGQAQFSLTTSVATGAETASASTGSKSVCDAAGNCATAGPITGVKVDRLAPSIIVTAPAGTYTTGQVVKAAYTCSDGGSGVAACTGTVAAGSAIDTAAAGPHTFTVDATDVAGNHSKLAVTYTVTAAPTPTPKPICNEKESGNNTGSHENDCEKHGVAVRPVTTPKPSPTPKPKPTHKPAAHDGDQKKGDQKDG